MLLSPSPASSVIDGFGSYCLPKVLLLPVDAFDSNRLIEVGVLAKMFCSPRSPNALANMFVDLTGCSPKILWVEVGFPAKIAPD